MSSDPCYATCCINRLFRDGIPTRFKGWPPSPAVKEANSFGIYQSQVVCRATWSGGALDVLASPLL
ncbi:MAG TPA: hypothetical protein VMB34_26125 [Acetobacteraceae bacterium]|nr:hypothetical protein [Acetobacteraceae bacterium]